MAGRSAILVLLHPLTKMRKNKFKACSGFTLIEVLVVISIIAILTTVAGGYWASSIKKSRNIERKSDLTLYRVALENYAALNNSYYPVSVNTNRLTVFCAKFLTTFIPDCPEDHIYGLDNFYTYNYQAYGSNPLDIDGQSVALRWVMWSKLETTDKMWVSCSNGKSGEVDEAGFSVDTATCPL